MPLPSAQAEELAPLAPIGVFPSLSRKPTVTSQSNSLLWFVSEMSTFVGLNRLKAYDCAVLIRVCRVVLVLPPESRLLPESVHGRTTMPISDGNPQYLVSHSSLNGSRSQSTGQPDASGLMMHLAAHSGLAGFTEHGSGSGSGQARG